MTTAQRAMCFAAWHDCWIAIIRASGGATQTPERAVRMGITRKAIGREESWGGYWRQPEVDRLLAVIWSISHAGDLGRQLRQINQPLTRAEGSEYAQPLLEAIGIEPHDREAYLNGICQRIFKCGLLDITDREWPSILAALNHTLQHRENQVHNHPHSGRGPVSRYHHRVGLRSAKKPASRDLAATTESSPVPAATEAEDAGNPF